MAAVQHRYGPAIVGYYGLIQSVVDGVKLKYKQLSIVVRASLLFITSVYILVTFSIWLYYIISIVFRLFVCCDVII